jgi:hypothetical protein
VTKGEPYARTKSFETGNKIDLLTAALKIGDFYSTSSWYRAEVTNLWGAGTLNYVGGPLNHRLSNDVQYFYNLMCLFM